MQETGIDEITVEEGGMRVSVRRTPELPAVVAAAPAAAQPGALEEPEIPPAKTGLWRVESPMVGTFYARALARASRRSCRRATPSPRARRCASSRR